MSDGVGFDELVARIQAWDPDTVDPVTAELHRAGTAFDDQYDRVDGVRAGGAHLWTGDAGSAWQTHLSGCATRVSLAAYALRQGGAALAAMATAAREAQQVVRAESAALTVAGQYGDPAALPGLQRDARQRVQRATETFHAAEQRARQRLWDLGDLAQVGPPPAAVDPPPPDRPWYEDLLAAPSGPVLLDGNGDPVGVDEDGNPVPGYRAAALSRMEIQEAGSGGLARVVPGLARAVRGGSAIDDVAASVAKSHAWRSSHIDPKIQEFYGLRDARDIQPWMRQEFLQHVATASTRSGRPFHYRLGGDDCYGALYSNPTTGQMMAIFYHASGKYAGQLASAFRVTGARRLEMLEYAATRAVR